MKKNEIRFSSKYQNLFKLLNGEFPEVDTVIMTGGRSSAKSFVVALLVLMGLVEKLWNILYTRFTNISITDSIKPEVDDKIELLNYQDKVVSTNTHIEYKGSRIAFKGIKTGSKQQTANLKSLSGFNIFVVDEAEELPNYETYEKVFLSIRSKNKRNLTFLILNPTSIHHWIFKHFFKSKEIEAGYNGVKGNVMYIHTSYLDVPKQYIADNIRRYYENLKETDLKKYNEVVMGGWTDKSEIRVFTNWKKCTTDFYDKLDRTEYLISDWGKSDPWAILGAKYYDGAIYLKEYNYRSENEWDEINLSKGNLYEKDRDGLGIVQWLFEKELKIDKSRHIDCDTNRELKIAMLRRCGYYNVYPAIKGNIIDGIDILDSVDVFYTECSKNIEFETEMYEWQVDRYGLIIEGKPIETHNHLMDCARYIARRFVQLGLIQKA